MRSDQIHTAMSQGNSRFKICQLTSKGVRILHKPGVRTEDTINSVLAMLGRGAPALGLDLELLNLSAIS